MSTVSYDPGDIPTYADDQSSSEDYGYLEEAQQAQAEMYQQMLEALDDTD